MKVRQRINVTGKAVVIHGMVRERLTNLLTAKIAARGFLGTVYLISFACPFFRCTMRCKTSGTTKLVCARVQGELLPPACPQRLERFERLGTSPFLSRSGDKSARVCLCLMRLVNCCIPSPELPLSPELPGRIAEKPAQLTPSIACKR